MNTLSKAKGLSVFVLAMLITGSIDSVRNLPATALFGNTLIFFLIFAALVFLIPTAAVSAQLSSAFPKQGGIYNWVKLAFGGKPAYLAIWLQWINTMVWFPTMLSFIAGTAAFLINPNLVHSKLYLVTSILVIYWIMTLVNLRGLKTSARIASFCTITGMVIPISLIILLAVIWIVLGKPLQLHLTTHTMIPHLGHSESWVSLTAVMASFLGMELATVHVRQINTPQTTFPKALLISVLTILATMLFGALAIAFVLPHNQINLVDGVMEAFTNFFNAYHLRWMIPVITIMLLIGSLGGMINWLISPAKGLLQAAEDGYLPKFFAKENKHQVPQNLLIIQACVVSFMGIAFLLMPSVNGSYWLLTDLSTQLYMLMYLLMFLAAIKMGSKLATINSAFKIPGGPWGLPMMACLGLMGSTISIIVGFFPPGNIAVGGAFHYILVYTSGMIAMIVPVIFFYLYKRSRQQTIA